MPYEKLLSAWKKSLRSRDRFGGSVTTSRPANELCRDALSAAVAEDESPDGAGRFRMIAQDHS